MTTANVPILEIQGLTKSFPGVKALKGVDLSLNCGEVLGLLGENGAGKSTLIKILAGVFAADQGQVRIDGRDVTVPSPVASRRLGIGVIHQELNLVPAQTVRENLFLGEEGGLFSILRARREFRQVRELSERLGMPLDPRAIIRDLTVAQQQTVEIAKALAFRSRILIMDEPTSALSPREVNGLFRMIRDLTAQGIGIIYVSHRLDEIFEICQGVTVFRDGEHVGTKPIQEVTRESLIEMMVGRKLEEEYPKRSVELGPPRLSVRNLSRGTAVRDVSFSVRRGEILALTGLVGAGRTETARLVFAADRSERGAIEVDGRILKLRNPRQAIAAGICLLTEDRKHQGLVLKHSLQENFGLPNLKRFSRWCWLNVRQERRAFQEHIRQLGIRATGPKQMAGTLSGGNQQKVVLAKWLERNADVIIFDEPTRGIDVGAKFEIYQLMNELARQGKAILMITSEFPEALGMADRILVMHDGRITGEITDVSAATQQELLRLSVA